MSISNNLQDRYNYLKLPHVFLFFAGDSEEESASSSSGSSVAGLFFLPKCTLPSSAFCLISSSVDLCILLSVSFLSRWTADIFGDFGLSKKLKRFLLHFYKEIGYYKLKSFSKLIHQYVICTYLVLLWPLVLFASAFSSQQQMVEAWP